VKTLSAQLLVLVASLAIAAHAMAAAKLGAVTRQLSAPGCCPMGLTFDGTALWVVDRKLNQVFRVDPKSGEVLRALPTPGFRPTGLSWDGKHLWIADRDRDELARLDPATGVVDRVLKVPFKSPRGVASDGVGLYVADAKTDHIYYLDAQDGTVFKKFLAPYRAPTGLVYDGRYLWSADRSTDEIYRIDPQRGKVIGIFKSPGPHPYGLAWDGRHLWNVDYQTRKLYRLRPRADERYQRWDKKQLRVEYTLHLYSHGPDPVTAADIFLAVPRSRYNQRLITPPTFAPEPDELLKDRWGQEVAHFRRPEIASGQTFEPRMIAEVELYRTRFWITPEKVGSLQLVPEEIKQQYLSNGRKYRLHDPAIRAAARAAIKNERNPYWMARGIYEHVRGTLEYKRTGGWDSAPLLLERGSGSCSEYAFVFIALCRAVGIPARYVGGIVTRGDDAFVDNVFHRWAEIYLPNVGWLPVDPDRGDKLTPRGQALGFGYVSNTLFVTTVNGGESEHLDWKYNGNARWTFVGRSAVDIEQTGELSPLEGGE